MFKVFRNIFSKKDKFRVDNKIVDRFIKNPSFPYLVSFPRTGSHWLRMIMELYFEKPSLVRVFYYKKAKDFTCYHTHDLELDVVRKNVLYLYRDPGETIYSQLNYHKEDINNKERIKYWSDIYGKHLSKWLIQEGFTTKKTIITYEGMKADINAEFKKVCLHFNKIFDQSKLENVLHKVSKEELSKKTKHDKQVVVLSNSYKIKRQEFIKKYSNFILERVYKQNLKLKSFFN
jgi:hypothetical protein